MAKASSIFLCIYCLNTCNIVKDYIKLLPDMYVRRFNYVCLALRFLPILEGGLYLGTSFNFLLAVRKNFREGLLCFFMHINGITYRIYFAAVNFANFDFDEILYLMDSLLLTTLFK